MSRLDVGPAIEHLDGFVQRRMSEVGIPSLVLALTDRTGLLHVGTYGYADLAAMTPTTETTLYELGSIGKSFTAVALLQLKNEGRIDLHAPVRDYLPWFQVRSRFAPITIHHLLSHTAGIIRGTDFAPDPRFEVWSLRDTESAYAPGGSFHYSNAGYKALGLLLERVEGRLYAQIMHERVLGPLGMNTTMAAITNDIRPRLAVGYAPLHDDRPFRRGDPLVPATWLETNTGDGCLASSVTDLATYLRLYLNRGHEVEPQVLTDENFALMTGRIIDLNLPGAGGHYGYGIATQEIDGRVVIGHGGGMVGYSTDMKADMEAGVGAVTLVNGIGDPGEFTTYALRLLQASVLGGELPDPPPISDPERVENASDYAGNYHSERQEIKLTANGQLLLLETGGEIVRLEAHGEDRFYVPHPDFNRFLLSFARDDQGEVTQASHGCDWWTNERYEGPTTFDYPDEWNAYPGHYRSHNPWLTNLRVVLRKGELRIVFSNGGEEVLHALDDGAFAAPQGSPERVRFDTVVDGEALRLNFSGNDFYRFFTE